MRQIFILNQGKNIYACALESMACYRTRSRFIKASKLVEELFHYLVSHSELFLDNFAQNIEGASLEELVTDFIAGMTDRFAIQEHSKLFDPRIEP